MNGSIDKRDPPVKGLTYLKVIVRHQLNTWPAVVQRRDYLRAMSQSESLREAVRQTYGAHVHNALHAVLSFDLVRRSGRLNFG